MKKIMLREMYLHIYSKNQVKSMKISQIKIYFIGPWLSFRNEGWSLIVQLSDNL